jgi:hypothetical protein
VIISLRGAPCRDESGDDARANRAPESFIHGLVFTLKGLPLTRGKPSVKRHRTKESIELVRGVLDELWHDCHLNITEQAAGIILPYVVTAEPGPYLRDIATALLNSSQRGVEIPVGRPIIGNIRGDLSYGSECCFLIWLAARFLQSAVLHQGERSTGNKCISGLLPADPGVNPVKRGRREHGLKLLAGKQRILELSVYIVHLSRTFQVLPGQCYKARAGFDRRDVQAPSDKAARQLAASAPDLEHTITAPDPRDPARLVDEFVRISRAAAVVLSRYLIKDLAVTTGRRFW